MFNNPKRPVAEDGIQMTPPPSDEKQFYNLNSHLCLDLSTPDLLQE